MKFQFNKTGMQRLKRERAVRLKALPTLKAKETALRLEVKTAQELLLKTENKLIALKDENSSFSELWLEFPAVLSLSGLDLKYRNIAGVKIPELQEACFELRDFSLYANRAWVPGGAQLLKEFCLLSIQTRILEHGLRVLERARKKTTQKVNLYEKVQIPEYNNAILKIKRFLEDQENLASAAQKIIKEKQRMALLDEAV